MKGHVVLVDVDVAGFQSMTLVPENFEAGRGVEPFGSDLLVADRKHHLLQARLRLCLLQHGRQ